jgi:uncharacterized protein (TIGR04255 family)
MIETFPNAPIVEALLDIRANLPPDASLEKLKSFHNNVRDRFPVLEEKRFIKTEFQFGKDEPQIAASEKGVEGFFFKSDREKKLIQFRLNGFTYNKLTPYENWKVFSEEACYFWDSFKELARPTKVERIALRYINRILVPLPFNDFSEYILTNPQIAPNLPQALLNFFLRFVINSPDSKFTAIVTETFEERTKDNKLPIILDIDVFSAKAYDINSKELWDNFEKIRDFKNQIFFNSITEKTKELFR